MKYKDISKTENKILSEIKKHPIFKQNSKQQKRRILDKIISFLENIEHKQDCFFEYFDTIHFLANVEYDSYECVFVFKFFPKNHKLLRQIDFKNIINKFYSKKDFKINKITSYDWNKHYIKEYTVLYTYVNINIIAQFILELIQYGTETLKVETLLNKIDKEVYLVLEQVLKHIDIKTEIYQEEEVHQQVSKLINQKITYGQLYDMLYFHNDTKISDLKKIDFDYNNQTIFSLICNNKKDYKDNICAFVTNNLETKKYIKFQKNPIFNYFFRSDLKLKRNEIDFYNPTYKENLYVKQSLDKPIFFNIFNNFSTTKINNNLTDNIKQIVNYHLDENNNRIENKLQWFTYQLSLKDYWFFHSEKSLPMYIECNHMFFNNEFDYVQLFINLEKIFFRDELDDIALVDFQRKIEHELFGKTIYCYDKYNFTFNIDIKRYLEKNPSLTPKGFLDLITEKLNDIFYCLYKENCFTKIPKIYYKNITGEKKWKILKHI